jgi:hypothetical protein
MTECERLIRDSLEEAKSACELERKTEATRRLSLLSDDWSDLLKTAVEGQFHAKTRDNIKQLLDTTQNVFKRVVYLISQVYAYGIDRRAMVGEEPDARYAELMDNPVLDVKMSEVNRYSNALGECIVGIIPKDGGIEYIILTPDLVTVTQKPGSPTEIDTLSYEVAYVNTAGDSDIKRVYWDIYGNHRITDANGVDITAEELPDNPDGVNPYRDPENPGHTILPFVVFHASVPIWDFWNWTSGQDLVDGTLMIGVLLTYVNYLLKMNSFRQLLITGANVDKLPDGLALDPAFVLKITGEGASASVLDFNQDSRPIMEVVKDKLNSLTNAYGVSGDLYRSSAGGASSGYALKLSREELYQRREEQVKVYKSYEHELFEKTRIVNNTAYPSSKISDNAEFSADFNETLFGENPTDIREQWKFDITIGAKSVTDYIRYLNPDMTEEEAEEKLRTNRRATGRVRELGIDTDAILARVASGSQQQAR